MLEKALKDQVVSVFASLKNKYTLEIKADKSHESHNDLLQLIEDVASCSELIRVAHKPGMGLSFKILQNDQPSSIEFKAVPTGHEFTTLLLAILNMDGIGKNLPDDVVVSQIKALKGNISINSYISLSCTNCPDVVQALNIMSIINPRISHTIIDGGIHQEEVEKLNIQAVPSVFVNGKLLHVGRSSLGELLSKLEEKVGLETKQTEQKTKNYDVVVAGGGPAGVSAAIYTARKGFSVAIVAQKMGGQLTETQAIENMISMPKTTGQEITVNLNQHLASYNIDILENRSIENTEVKDGMKHIFTSLNEELITPALIIATGASWRKLNVPGEKEYVGSGVAYCTHCDGPFYKNKRVVVVGGGNSGLEGAIDLSSIASEITVLEFANVLKGDKVLQEKIKSLPNVKIITGAETKVIKGDGNKVVALEYLNRSSGETETIETDGVFVQIGLNANSGLFREHVSTNGAGEIMVDAHCRTGSPGIYAAGDVTLVPYKQIVVAMGEGAKAALSAFEDKIKGLQLAG